MKYVALFFAQTAGFVVGRFIYEYLKKFFRKKEKIEFDGWYK